MNQDTVTTFFALLALVSLAGTAAIAVSAVVLRLAGGPGWLVSRRAEVGRVSLRLATVVAATATLGSLWYSEVVGYTPCVLCWGQRVFMYPLALVLTVGVVRSDVAVRFYALALAIPGAAIGIYHSWLQAYPRVTSFCSLDAPCAERHVWEFGFVSIPLMATAGFVFVIALSLIALPWRDVQVSDGDVGANEASGAEVS